MQIWSRAEHRHVMPFLGFTIDNGMYPAFITEWMENGSLRIYLQRNPHVDPLPLVVVSSTLDALPVDCAYVLDRGHSVRYALSALERNYSLRHEGRK